LSVEQPCVHPLVTPKLFTQEIKQLLLNAYMQILQIYMLGKIQLPRNTVTYSLGAFLLLSTFSLFPLGLLYLNEINYSQLLQLNNLFSQLFKSAKLPYASSFDYIGQRMVDVHSVFAETRPFFGSVMIVYVVFSISVILFSAITKASPEDQDRLADKMLRWGVVVFLYSRALSMME
jgi:hypothetical protein